MRKLSADIVFPVASKPVKNGVVVVDEDGQILAVSERAHHDPASLEIYRGAIVPGFINTHCHLELSHMKGLAPTGTGLLPFLKTVVNYRNFKDEEIQQAIKEGDKEMYEAGIVAVGDISNKLDTAEVKNRSKIRYYTFVEMFDFLQESLTDQTFDGYYEVYKGQSTAAGNMKSCVPHAPYTVSRKLFEKINAINGNSVTVSIHNQETTHENDFFINKSGDFIGFFSDFGFPSDSFAPTGKTSIHYALAQMNPHCRTLFVHNTMSTPEDIQAAQKWNKNIYWATCPNANLYIENRLPNYKYFMDAGAKMTIGTDSLTSNWQLSIIEEMKTIARLQSHIPFDELLKWATINGAEALGFEDTLGTLEKGKQPGLNLLSDFSYPGNLTQKATVRKLL